MKLGYTVYSIAAFAGLVTAAEAEEAHGWGPTSVEQPGRFTTFAAGHGHIHTAAPSAPGDGEQWHEQPQLPGSETWLPSSGPWQNPVKQSSDVSVPTQPQIPSPPVTSPAATASEHHHEHQPPPSQAPAAPSPPQSSHVAPPPPAGPAPEPITQTHHHVPAAPNTSHAGGPTHEVSIPAVVIPTHSAGHGQEHDHGHGQEHGQEHEHGQSHSQAPETRVQMPTAPLETMPSFTPGPGMNHTTTAAAAPDARPSSHQHHGEPTSRPAESTTSRPPSPRWPAARPPPSGARGAGLS
ncbi:hypothetical protein JX265_006789 [Neoarthrinium moseri]|uniref:Uncharacterized protein n=1 Tax=Neoarthrinium moseri TaxID=1658444 RepID=A0A9Q0ANQ2_9PEZI|nr:hypothetical protein JX265_006789 [Neoarthrinium moseri]